MDDSLVKANGIYVYAHAIVSDTELPQTLVFVGTPATIYSHEEEIISFIQENYDSPFLACEHYRSRYSTVKDHIAGFVNRHSRLSKSLHRLHVAADQTARGTARRYLDQILDGGDALQEAARRSSLPVILLGTESLVLPNF